MKPVKNAHLMLAVALLAAVGFLGCSHSNPSQTGQSFAQGSGSSASSGSNFAQQGSPNSAAATSDSGSAPGSSSDASAPDQSQQSAPPSAQASASQPVVVTIPRGTLVRVALDHAISSATAHAGDGFTATLLDPLRADGQTIARRDARVRGHIVSARASGRLSGTAHLDLTLDSVEISGQPVAVQTDTIARVGKTHKKRDIIAIGGGSALGAIIGGIAGGGKGAAIGAAAGAGAGTAGAAVTGKENIVLPVEATLDFRLTASLRLTH